MHPPLPVELVNRGSNVATREFHDNLPEGWIPLADYVVEAHDSDTGLLQLLIRLPGLDGLVLTDITHE